MIHGIRIVICYELRPRENDRQATHAQRILQDLSWVVTCNLPDDKTSSLTVMEPRTIHSPLQNYNAHCIVFWSKAYIRGPEALSYKAKQRRDSNLLKDLPPVPPFCNKLIPKRNSSMLDNPSILRVCIYARAQCSQSRRHLTCKQRGLTALNKKI